MEKNAEGIVTEIERVLRMEGQAILDCAARLRDPAHSARLVRAVGLLAAALDRGGKIVVTGVGKSGKIAQKISATLCSTGSLAVFLHPTEGLHGDLGVIREGDAILALSYTGNTEELMRLVPSFKALNASVIGVGGNDRSRLAAACDVWLDASVAQEACPHNLAPTTSSTLALAIGDALAVALMHVRGFDAQRFASIHPGGALGNRLNLKVADVMHHGDAVAWVGPEATMDEVVMLLTQKRLGAVLVTEGAKLLGIIVEGDIRRALSHRQKFFEFKAREVMTRDPITARPGFFAREALELMENRNGQISVLPVVDEAGHWKGLVRVHDLITSL